MTVDTPVRGQPPAGPPVAGPDRRPIYLGLVILLALLLIAVLLAVATLAARHRDGVAAGGAPHAVSGPLAGRHEARLDLTSGVGEVTVRTADLGDRLYRASTPAGPGPVPEVTDQDGSLQVGVGGGGGPASVEILLSSHVTWQLRLGGGASEARLDLRGGPVSAVDIASGVSSVELWLPRPGGTVPVRETGGASEFTVHAPSAVPVLVRVTGGAGQASIDGVVHAGVPGNTVYPADGWDRAADRYELDAVGGLSQLTLDRS
jgi:hypothetical protein